jgi:hypothetical protein
MITERGHVVAVNAETQGDQFAVAASELNQ